MEQQGGGDLRRERVVPVSFLGSLRPMAFTTNTLTVYVLKGIRFMRVADWRDASPEKIWDPESPLAENVIMTPVMGLFPLLPFVQLTLSVLVPGEPTITFIGALGGTVVWCGGGGDGGVCVCVCVCVCTKYDSFLFLCLLSNTWPVYTCTTNVCRGCSTFLPAFAHSYTA